MALVLLWKKQLQGRAAAVFNQPANNRRHTSGGEFAGIEDDWPGPRVAGLPQAGAVWSDMDVNAPCQVGKLKEVRQNALVDGAKLPAFVSSTASLPRTAALVAVACFLLVSIVNVEIHLRRTSNHMNYLVRTVTF